MTLDNYYIPTRNVINHLRNHGKALIDGVLYEGVSDKTNGKCLVPGDIYIAERNSGPKVLTFKRWDPRGWVEPVEEGEYFFDTWECVGVRKVEPNG